MPTKKKAPKPKAKASGGRASQAKKTAGRKWSGKVNATSDAMDLAPGVFKEADPKKVADSLKRSAEGSKRRKATPFQSAMSMLNFEINRGGRNLTAARKKTLEQAKVELRKDFGRE